MEERQVELTRVPAELIKVLKFENIAASGGEAKHMVADGLVVVNGEIELRKRRKLYPGDRIQVLDILLVLSESDS